MTTDNAIPTNVPDPPALFVVVETDTGLHISAPAADTDGRPDPVRTVGVLRAAARHVALGHNVAEDDALKGWLAEHGLLCLPCDGSGHIAGPDKVIPCPDCNGAGRVPRG